MQEKAFIQQLNKEGDTDTLSGNADPASALTEDGSRNVMRFRRGLLCWTVFRALKIKLLSCGRAWRNILGLKMENIRNQQIQNAVLETVFSVNTSEMV